MAVDEDEIEDLSMLATEETEEETPWIYQETQDGNVRAGPKPTGLTPNPLSLLVKGIRATESETFLGLDIYFEEPTKVEGTRPCPHTKKDMVIPTQSFEEHIGKSARVYKDRDYDGERQEHYKHVTKSHKLLKAGGLYIKHPLPLKTWAPPIHEKDLDDEAGGFGTNFWPYGRQKRDKIAKKYTTYLVPQYKG
jgi:hypothetical protein